MRKADGDAHKKKKVKIIIDKDPNDWVRGKRNLKLQTKTNGKRPSGDGTIFAIHFQQSLNWSERERGGSCGVGLKLGK